MQEIIYRYSKVNYRSSKTGIGYKLDFMKKIEDNEEQLFINIYDFSSFDDFESYKITENGILEKDDVLNSYLDIKKNGTINLVFKTLIHKSLSLKDISNIEDYIEPKLREQLKSNKKDEYNEMIRNVKVYYSLMKSAITNSFGYDYEFKDLKDIVLAINKLNESKMR